MLQPAKVAITQLEQELDVHLLPSKRPFWRGNPSLLDLFQFCPKQACEMSLRLKAR
jgi:hypothetical protein